MTIMTKKRIADLLVDTLVAVGVKGIYGLAGDSLNGITDSIRTRENIQWIPVRHEESAALNHDGPALVEVVVNRQKLSMPPTIGPDNRLQSLHDQSSAQPTRR